MSATVGPNGVEDGLIILIDPVEDDLSYNLTDYAVWTYSGSSFSPSFSRNGEQWENIIIEDTDPFGNTSFVWEARPDGASNADGGWNSYNSSPYLAIDSGSKYRYSFWCRRTILGDGRLYMGMYGYNGTTNTNLRRTSDGVISTNVYFWSSQDPPTAPTKFVNGEWCLFVGHVHPTESFYSGTDPDSGIYDTGSNKIWNISLDCEWRFGNVHARPRTYLFYSNTNVARQQWFAPRFEKLDGTELPLSELFTDEVATNLAKSDINTRMVNGLSVTSSNSYNCYNIGGVAGSYVDLGWGAGVNPSSQPFTIISWVKASDTTTNQMWVDNGDVFTNNTRFYVSLNDMGIQSSPWTNSGVPQDTDWHMSTIVMDGTNATLYLDNAAQQVQKSYTSFTIQNNLKLGGRHLESSYKWSGVISKTQIYDRALTVDEIKQNFHAMRGRFGL